MTNRDRENRKKQVIVHGPDNIFINSRGAKPHHVFQQAYYPLITYLCDSNRDRVAYCLHFEFQNGRHDPSK